MAKVDKQTYLTRLNEILGDDPDDAALSLIEDFEDTYDSLENGDHEELERLRTENETLLNSNKELKKKYRERFLNPNQPESGNIHDPLDDDDDDDDESPTKFEDLFETKK